MDTSAHNQAGGMDPVRDPAAPYDPDLTSTERRALILAGQLANEAHELRLELDQANRWLDSFASLHATWGALGGDADRVEAEIHAIWERMKRMLDHRAEKRGAV